MIRWLRGLFQKEEPSRVVWFNLKMFPTHVGFCPNKEAWDIEMKRMDIKDFEYPQRDSGSCTSFREAGKSTVALITFLGECDDTDKCRTPAFVALVAHECMHAWRIIREDIGEDAPSAEFEAYMLQALVEQTLQAYSDTRVKLWR